MTAWLFERTIETAAWVALILAWTSLALAVVWFGQWVNSMNGDVPNQALLYQSAKAAASFVGFSSVVGFLAAIDHYIFDFEE